MQLLLRSGLRRLEHNMSLILFIIYRVQKMVGFARHDGRKQNS